MSEPEQEPVAPVVGQTVPELLAEIRDLLEQILASLPAD